MSDSRLSTLSDVNLKHRKCAVQVLNLTLWWKTVSFSTTYVNNIYPFAVVSQKRFCIHRQHNCISCIMYKKTNNNNNTKVWFIKTANQWRREQPSLKYYISCFSKSSAIDRMTIILYIYKKFVQSANPESRWPIINIRILVRLSNVNVKRLYLY